MILDRSRSVMGAKFMEKMQGAQLSVTQNNDDTQGHINAYLRSEAHGVEDNTSSVKFKAGVKGRRAIEHIFGRNQNSGQHAKPCGLKALKPMRSHR
ncbi:Hypothetical predicted protein [Olea europaea subsp. europaea]|uniref:Uncharacterized protein n=1 Tax=Olea europaea subsp. europaea TaxID=158383 RepID=A0A8S0R888_OLEEU|nr:Hypothetical predicted protein [Olea europaea subsp. europaea]